jgi:hypothetical protein
MRILRFALNVVAITVVCAAARAAGPTDDLIAKARAFLGAESALNAVNTVHFVGTLDLVEQVSSPADKTKLVENRVSVPVEIHFKKPMQQRVSAKSDKLIETTALDGYDGWQRRQDATDPSKWQLTLLDKEQIKRLQANTWENLSFFKGLEKKGGRLDYLGEARADGRACVKLAFVHAPNIVFNRYFDKVTGQLVLTETESGSTIREEGQIIARGVRFPKRVITNSPGKVTTITFEKITVNEAVSDAEFAVPSLMPAGAAAAKPPAINPGAAK